MRQDKFLYRKTRKYKLIWKNSKFIDIFLKNSKCPDSTFRGLDKQGGSDTL